MIVYVYIKIETINKYKGEWKHEKHYRIFK